MRYTLLILLITKLSATHAQSLFPTLEKNIKDYYLMAGDDYKRLQHITNNLEVDPKAEDRVTVELYQKIKPSDSLVNLLLNSFTSKGIWSDINYRDMKKSGWEPKYHAERLLVLTTLYTNPSSKYFNDTKIKSVLHKALNFWFEAKLVCPNWWYNEIGIPKTLGPVFIMLKAELSPKELEGAVSVLNNSSFKQTGQNKVWQAGNVLFKAILLSDAKLAKQARDTIFSELQVSELEGIQADFSFHQHGPQQQFGNYGLSFINTESFWARILSGTNLALDADKLKILRDLMLNGFNWVTWNGFLDINSLGRQFFKDVRRTKSLGIAYSMLDMSIVDPENKSKYLDFISRNYTGNSKASLTGHTHFWRSDMSVHRSPAWWASIKMSSDRVIATEAINGENLKGYHVGDGTTFVTVDGDEYDEIFPYWDWKKLPGVTSLEKEGKLPEVNGFQNKGDFTGGISNGIFGITAFKLNRDSLYANKAWFFLNNKMICLGSDIRSKVKQPISTTINQVNRNGNIYFFDTKVQQVKAEKHPSQNLKWVYHDKVGYYYLTRGNGNIIAKEQTGNWGEIAAVYKGDKNITKPVFTLEINHNLNTPASYSYVILPGISLMEMERFQPDFEVAKNDNSAQIISIRNKSLLMCVIYQPFKATISGHALDFKNPGMYILELSGSKKIYAADPTQKLKDFSLNVNGKRVNIPLPQGADKGKTTQLALN